MENDENNAGGVAVNPELETDVVETTPETPGDPFDSIEDEGLRAEAKKYRSIANRHKDKPAPEVATETKVVTPDTNRFVTKNDMAVIATREAKELVSKEVAAQYEELIKIPLGGFDPLDPKSIAANLKERYAIFQARKSPEKEEVPDLTATTVVAGSGSRKEVKPDKKEPPNFFMPKGPDSWYPKKES